MAEQSIIYQLFYLPVYKASSSLPSSLPSSRLREKVFLDIIFAHDQ